MELFAKVELRCVAEGDGNISFVWSFNSTVIIQGLDIGRYDIRSAQTGDLQWCSVLTIKRAKSDDFGEYTCVARNHLGYDFIKFTVIKKGKTATRIASNNKYVFLSLKLKVIKDKLLFFSSISFIAI